MTTYPALFENQTGETVRLEGEIVFPDPTNEPSTPAALHLHGPFHIAFNTPNILTGVTLFTLADTQVLLIATLSITTAWDGNTPKIHVGTTGAADGFTNAIDATQAQTQVGAGFCFDTPPVAAQVRAVGGAVPFIVLVDDGSGGNPGASKGAADFFVIVGTPIVGNP